MFHFGTDLLKNEIAIQNHPKQKNCLKQAISQSKFLLCSHLLFSHLLYFRLVNVPHLRVGSPAHFQNFLSHMLLRWLVRKSTRL